MAAGFKAFWQRLFNRFSLCKPAFCDTLLAKHNRGLVFSWRKPSKLLIYFETALKFEVDEFTGLIQRREFDMMFDSFEAYDVQETRRISREEGITEGYLNRLVEQIIKKMQKNYTIEEIADMLEESEDKVLEIRNIAEKYAPDCDVKKISEEYQAKRKRTGTEYPDCSGHTE